ncbi:MAG: glycosyltransferase family 2 protein [Thermaurantimonas sp.]|uniref:glycosyltransferase family 2 protein n=1 Tax=Thermaurantimonas sp. TaxID=2681568 RepID=UPI00391AFF62
MAVNAPLVSVIVPNYNHAPYLTERLKSIENQTYKNIELILLDDCSTDGSIEILRNWAASRPYTQLIINKNNSGSPFAQWNKGLSIASGKYVWIAESDDACEPNLLEVLVNMLENEKDASLAFSQSILIDKVGNKLHSFNEHYKFVFKSERWEADFCADAREECRRYMLFHNTIPNASAVLFRRKDLLKVLPVDQDFKLNGDWFFYVKLLSVSNKFCYTAKPLNYFRYHANTQRLSARNKTHAFFEIIRIQDFILEKFPETIDDFIKAKRLCAYWWIGNINGKSLLNKALLKQHIQLYRHFSPYFKHFWWRIAWHFLFISFRKILIITGLKKPLKRLRSKLFPGKYFELELPE